MLLTEPALIINCAIIHFLIYIVFDVWLILNLKKKIQNN